MINNRLILTLLISDGLLVNSRGFILNPVCNISTMLTYLNFDLFDEIVILDVTRANRNIGGLSRWISQISSKCFIPICGGGGVTSIHDCETLSNSGIDKVVINSAAFTNRKLIKEVSRTFGSQFVVSSIDAIFKDGKYYICTNDGKFPREITVVEWVKQLEDMGSGEIYLRSIKQDGSALGYDIKLIKLVSESTTLPIIAAGGFGHFRHLENGIISGAQAVSIGNLFHFMGESLSGAKQYLLNDNVKPTTIIWPFAMPEKIL